MTDITLTVPALDKLLDYLASGVGAIAGPLLAPWRASQEGKARIITARDEAEVRRIQAETEGSTSQLIAKARAEAREYVASDQLESDGGVVESNIVRKAVRFQAEKRVRNIQAIAGHAAEELKDKEVPDHDPDPDWIARFFDGAQDVSSEELQRLWGKILAGEVKSPGETSLRTLSILRNMTQQEARDFSNLMRLRIDGFIFNEGLQRVLGERLGLIVHFSHIGLLGGFGESQNITLGDDGTWTVEHYGHALRVEGPPSLELGPLMGYKTSVITIAGLELAKLCQHEPDLLYLSYFAKFLAKQNCKLRIGMIVDQDAKGFRYSSIHIIEPFVDSEERNQEESNNSSHKAPMQQTPAKAWTGKAYPAYKDSGVEWLGKVPQSWTMFRLKGVVANVTDLTRELDDDNIYLALEHVESWTGKFSVMNNSIDFDSQAKRFQSRDVLFGKLRPYLAKVVCPGRDGICAGEFLVLRPRHSGLLSKYLEQLLRSKPVIFAIDASTFGAKMPRADWQFIGNMRIPLPPLPEQHAIAHFLDHANQRIQRHLQAKEKLIKLLEEQKQVIIHQAVTGQIDVRTGQPYPAYKDSGVEWLGKVPEHWEVRRVKSLSLVKRGASPRPIADAKYFDEDGEYAWVRISDVTASEQYLENTTQRLSPLGQSLSVKLQPGSLFLSIAGSVGKPMITRIKCCIHDGFVYFPQLKGSTEFLFRVFSCKAPFGRLGKFGTQLNLNTDTVGNICLG